MAFALSESDHLLPELKEIVQAVHDAVNDEVRIPRRHQARSAKKVMCPLLNQCTTAHCELAHSFQQLGFARPGSVPARKTPLAPPQIWAATTCTFKNCRGCGSPRCATCQFSRAANSEPPVHTKVVKNSEVFDFDCTPEKGALSRVEGLLRQGKLHAALQAAVIGLQSLQKKLTADAAQREEKHRDFCAKLGLSKPCYPDAAVIGRLRQEERTNQILRAAGATTTEKQELSLPVALLISQHMKNNLQRPLLTDLSSRFAEAIKKIKSEVRMKKRGLTAMEDKLRRLKETEKENKLTDQRPKSALKAIFPDQVATLEKAIRHQQGAFKLDLHQLPWKPAADDGTGRDSAAEALFTFTPQERRGCSTTKELWQMDADDIYSYVYGS